MCHKCINRKIGFITRWSLHSRCFRNTVNLTQCIKDSTWFPRLFAVFVAVLVTQIAVTNFPELFRWNNSPVSVSTAKNEVDISVSVFTGTSVVLRKHQRVSINPDVQKEAMSAMNLALDMDAQGKRDKAIKLFEHAIKLDPTHADILTEYGEFLEMRNQDVIQADHLYSKALLLDPTHSKALQNSRRVSPLVEKMDQTIFNNIDEKRDLLYKIPESHAGLRRQKREAYFSYIYHSNAIEGNTLTLAQTRAIIETRLAVGGKSLVEQNEVLGLDAALCYMNNTLLRRTGNFKLSDLLDIHKRVLGFVDPYEAGQFRTTQVYVGSHSPPEANELPKLMDEFVEWLNSEEAANLHPIEFAALAHFKLVFIHPFYDGNGRTSRLLMNLILMQSGFPPVSVKVEDRLKYYEVLELAGDGDVRPFIRFIAECTDRTLDEFLSTTVQDYKAISPLKQNNTRSDRVIFIDNEDS